MRGWSLTWILATLSNLSYAMDVPGTISIENKTELHFHWWLDPGWSRVGADEGLDFNLDICYT
jgi:hypothetical protein